MVQERKVVEEVSGWLRVFDDGSVDRTWLGPPEVKFMADPVPAHQDFIDGVSVHDILIDKDSGLRVRAYAPETRPDEAPPVILHLHGGGFCISQADWYMYYAVYTSLARRARAIVLSPYLRLAPEHRLPAAIDDGYSALLWLGSLARAGPGAGPLARADFSRVFLIGDSSGGNLVHHVAARAGDDPAVISPAKLAGLIPIHPGFVRAERSRSEKEMPETPFLTLDMAEKFLRLALPEGETRDCALTCPMGEAAAALEEVAVEAPMLLCVAEKDLIIDTEMEYYEAMKKAGKKVELLVSAGMSHSFYLNRIAVEVDPATKSETDRLFQGIADFIARN